MKRKLLLMMCCLMAGLITLSPLHSQDEANDSKTAWETGGSIGLDLSQLALINPMVGAGENRLAFGGINTLFAKFKEGKQMWDTDGVLQLAVQRLGSSDNPFTKNLDVIRVNSKYGYGITEKWYGGILATFESLLLNTYNDLALSSTATNSLAAKFLSPAAFQLSPGLDFVMDEHFSVFLSPFGYKATIVLDDELAALGVHGNPWTSATEFENIKHEIGAGVRAKYTNTFAEKLKYNSELSLFYDYLSEEHGTEFIDVFMVNDLGIELFKGFSVTLLVDLRWDHDLASVLGADEVPDGETEFRKWMITETFVAKYNYTF